MTEPSQIEILSRGAGRQVLSPVVIVVVLALLLLLLPLTYFLLREESGTGQLDEALSRAEFSGMESNPDVRLRYARNLFTRGKVVESIDVLQPLRDDRHPGAEALYREIEFAAYNFVPEPYRTTLANRLKASITTLDDLTPKDLEIAGALGLFLLVAEQDLARGDFLSAARNFHRAGEFQRAAQAYDQVINQALLEEAVPVALAAGSTDMLLTWLSRYATDSEFARSQLFNVARQTGRHAYLTPDNQLLPTGFAERDSWHEASVLAQVATGELEGALQLLELMLAEQPDSEAARRLRWQVMRWTGRAEQSLADALWLVQHNDANGAILDASVPDAIALYYFDLADDMFRARQKRASLRPRQLQQWFETQEFLGTWDRAAADVEKLIHRQPRSQLLQDWKTRFALLNNNYALLASNWSLFRQAGTMNLENITAYARAFWLEGDYDTALTVLSAAPAEVRDNDYWIMLTDIARRAGNETAFLAGINELLRTGQASYSQMFAWAEASFDSDAEKLGWYWSRYERTGEPLLLMRVASLAVSTRSLEHLLQVQQRLHLIERPEDRADFYLYLGQYYAQAGQPDPAYGAFRQGLALSPTNANLLQARAWLSIDQGNNEGLMEAYEAGRGHWKSYDWTLLLAAIANHYNLKPTVAFLNQYLARIMPDDLTVNYNLYVTLLGHDNHTQARALAHRLMSQLDAQVEDIPAYVKSGLTVQLRGDKAHFNTLTREYLFGDDGNTFELGMANLIRLERFEMAYRHFSRRIHQRQDVSDWLTLQMAFHRGDQQLLAHVMDTANVDRLPPADVVTAYERLGLPHHAASYARAQLHDPRNGDEAVGQLRRQAVSNRAESHRLVNLSQQDYSNGYRRYAILNRFVFTDALWTLIPGYERVQTSDATGLIREQTSAVLALGARHLRKDRVYEWRLEHDSLTTSRTGASLSVEHQLNRALRYRINLAAGSSAQLDNNWRAWGERDLLGMNVVSQPFRRLRVSVGAEREQYASRKGPGRRNATAYNLDVNYNLSRFNPAVSTFVSHYGRNFNDLSPILLRSGPTSIPLVPVDTSASRLGIRLEQGQMGGAPIQNRSANWLVELAGSCDHESNECGMDWNVGYGVRLYGGDRLSIGASRSTVQALQGRASTGTVWRIDYTKHY